MPLPVAHAFVGAALAEALLPRLDRHRLRKVLAAGALAVTPDLDFLLVWVLGRDREWHRGISHSLVVAALIGCAVLAWRGRERWQMALVCSLAVAFHGLLDALTTVHGRGVQLLWPFWRERLSFGIVDLWEIQSGWLADGELGRSLQISLLELLVLGSLVLGLVWVRRCTVRRGAQSRMKRGISSILAGRGAGN